MTTLDATTALVLPNQENGEGDLYHWHRCLQDFLQFEFERSGSAATLMVYECHLRLFFKDYAHKHPADISRQEIIAFLHHPSRSRSSFGKPVGINSINQRLTVLRTFYNFALDYEVPSGIKGKKPIRLMQGKNPARGIPYGRPPQRIRYLTEQEIKALFAQIGSDARGMRDRALYLFLFYTARRRAEVLRLRWSSLEPTTFHEKDGSTRQGWAFKFFGKGKSRVEDVQELPFPAYQALIDYLTVSGRLETMQPDSPLFLATYPGMGKKWKDGQDRTEAQPVCAMTVNEHLKQYARAAGITKKVSLHILRHSAARMRKELGADLFAIQKLLRHASIATTQRYLTLLSTPNDDDAAKLADRFSEL